jgi:hypothetical protein
MVATTSKKHVRQHIFDDNKRNIQPYLSKRTLIEALNPYLMNRYVTPRKKVSSASYEDNITVATTSICEK